MIRKISSFYFSSKLITNSNYNPSQTQAVGGLLHFEMQHSRPYPHIVCNCTVLAIIAYIIIVIIIDMFNVA